MSDKCTIDLTLKKLCPISWSSMYHTCNILELRQNTYICYLCDLQEKFENVVNQTWKLAVICDIDCSMAKENDELLTDFVFNDPLKSFKANVLLQNVTIVTLEEDHWSLWLKLSVLKFILMERVQCHARNSAVLYNAENHCYWMHTENCSIFLN